MDTLRLVILFIGLVLIAAVYLRYREPQQPADDSPAADKPSWLARLRGLLSGKRDSAAAEDYRIGPHISSEDVDSLGAIRVHGSDSPAEELDEDLHIGWDSMTPVAPQDELIIVFNILAGADRSFSGRQIQQAAEQAGFVYGDRQIFHYYAGAPAQQGIAVCSFANVVEPGHFAEIDTAEFVSPGISLFARLPGPLEAREAFRLSLDKARQLAELLDAKLYDESRSILSEQTIAHIKEKVEAFRFKQQMAAMQQRRHER